MGNGRFRTDYNMLESNKENIRQLYVNKKVSMYNISRTFEISVNTLKILFNKWKIKIRNGKGEEHSQWKGGKQIIQGYPATRDPTHPRARNNGYVFEHLITMEKNKGSVVKRETPIHHIDCDRMNYDINNLYLCEGHSEHRSIHVSLEICARELFKKGLIKFSDGKYYVV